LQDELAALTRQRNGLQEEIAALTQQRNGLREAVAMQPAIVVQPPTAGLPPATVAKASEEMVLALITSIPFRPDTARLDRSNTGIIDNLAAGMLADPSLKILVRGYSAPFGAEYGQLRLSENRARVIQDYLVSRGISIERIFLEWVGATEVPSGGSGSNYNAIRSATVFSMTTKM
jgi:outer membrane protein OmpA-like peptidoglycan-associated protein